MGFTPSSLFTAFYALYACFFAISGVYGANKHDDITYSYVSISVIAVIAIVVITIVTCCCRIRKRNRNRNNGPPPVQHIQQAVHQAVQQIQQQHPNPIAVQPYGINPTFIASPDYQGLAPPPYYLPQQQHPPPTQTGFSTASDIHLHPTTNVGGFQPGQAPQVLPGGTVLPQTSGAPVAQHRPTPKSNSNFRSIAVKGLKAARKVAGKMDDDDDEGDASGTIASIFSE